ncbi:MAG: glycosyl hydrolase family 8 [Sphingomonadales bacterium]
MATTFSRRSFGSAALGASLLGDLLATQETALAQTGRADGKRRLREGFVSEWAVYKSLYLTPDGRILDTFNNKITHTEGQGTGMLLAAAANDRTTFAQIWRWTQARLQRADALFYWKWDDRASSPIPDPNNATDGDIFIAWALLRAGQSWANDVYRVEAEKIIQSLEDNAIKVAASRPVISPGTYNFTNSEGATLNLSYYIFPALQDFATFRKNGVWERVYENGVAILEAARFGKWQLPVDWITVSDDGMVARAKGWPPRFGYDVVRVPLYLVWAQHDGAMLARFNAFADAYGGPRKAPSWWDSQTGRSSQYDPEGGVVAVRQITRLASGRDWAQDTKKIQKRYHQLPKLTEKDDYYPASLAMLSRLALIDILNRA